MSHRLWRVVVLALLCLPLCGFDAFRKSVEDVERGNALLEEGKPREALSLYDTAAKRQPEAAGVHYNRAAALAKLGRLDEARQALLAATQTRDRSLRAKAFYNLGNVLHQLKRYDEAATAYQNALRHNPRHNAAKWNLELTLKRKREKDQKDQKNQKDQKDQKQKDQNNQKEQKDQKHKDQKDKKNQKDQKQKDQKNQKDQKQQERAKQDQKQQERAKQDPRKPEMRQLDQVLDALDRNDKNLQRRRARMIRRAYRPPAKDW
jgi:Ca-activated chloride channel family protein